MQQEKDLQLWEIAKRRAGFKYHLAGYLGMSCFFWLTWFLSGHQQTTEGMPWPVWPMFGWGIGLLFHFLGAYVYSKEGGTEREYEKLIKNKQG